MAAPQSSPAPSSAPSSSINGCNPTRLAAQSIAVFDWATHLFAVPVVRGRLVTNCGHTTAGVRVLHTEELLYLMETGAVEALVDGVKLTVQEGIALLTAYGGLRSAMASLRVYRHLKLGSHIVLRPDSVARKYKPTMVALSVPLAEPATVEAADTEAAAVAAAAAIERAVNDTMQSMLNAIELQDINAVVDSRHDSLLASVDWYLVWDPQHVSVFKRSQLIAPDRIVLVAGSATVSDLLHCAALKPAFSQSVYARLNRQFVSDEIVRLPFLPFDESIPIAVADTEGGRVRIHQFSAMDDTALAALARQSTINECTSTASTSSIDQPLSLVTAPS